MRRFPGPTAVAVLALALSLLCGGGAARSQEASPDALTAARELVTTAHLADNFRKVVPIMMQTMMQQLKPAIVQAHPDAAADYDAITPVLIEGFQGRIDIFVEGVARIYAKHFTVDELHQLNDFYRTAAGQKYVDQLPTLTQESMQMGQSVGQQIGNEVRDRIIEELRKRGHKI